VAGPTCPHANKPDSRSGIERRSSASSIKRIRLGCRDLQSQNTDTTQPWCRMRSDCPESYPQDRVSRDLVAATAEARKNAQETVRWVTARAWIVALCRGTTDEPISFDWVVPDRLGSQVGNPSQLCPHYSLSLISNQIVPMPCCNIKLICANYRTVNYGFFSSRH
jgi:hypothetical protein